MEAFFELHKPQLLSSNVPEILWPALFNKITNQIFDSGEKFELQCCDVESEDEESDKSFDFEWSLVATTDISAADPNEIYLVDHAWTFRVDLMRDHLTEIPGLLDRICNMMGIVNGDDKLEKVMKNIWKFANFYTIGGGDNISIENQMPVWYLCDELGSSVRHSDTGNFRLVPFIYIPQQITYSLLFPLRDIEAGEQISRDYAEGITDPNLRKVALLPWLYSDLSHESFVQTEPDEDYYQKGRIEETLPNPDNMPPDVDFNKPLTVFTQYEMVKQTLTDPTFEIVGTEEEADVWWLTKHFKGYKEMSELYPNKFINQFPFENVITVKDLLYLTARRTCAQVFDEETLDCKPDWLPITFNLKTELIKFVAYYQNRKKKELDNHWIVKPFNLARGLDTYVTGSLDQIVRLSQTGPKIVQKYVEDPVLFNRPEVGPVKFDIRYVMLVRDVGDNVDAYIYRNFFLRFSNHVYSLDNFDDYEKHFTVMNYNENAPLYHLKCDEFGEEWKRQYPQNDWDEIEERICIMLKQILVNAGKKKPPCGIGSNTQSRALYAADIMLGWGAEGKMVAKLLEVNWTPDCKRACDYYPNFYNQVFRLLFLNDIDTGAFKKL